MASQNEKEMDLIIDHLQKIKGSFLSRYAYNEKVLQLYFEKEDLKLWLTFSLKPGAPYFFSSENRIFLVPTLKKPLGLFLKTHFLNETLVDIKRNTHLGRVVEIVFENHKSMVVSLFPGGQNIELISGAKNVFAFKPKEILAKASDPDYTAPEIRGPEFFEEQWQKQGSSREIKKVSGDLDQKELKKKQKGLDQMLEKLDKMIQSDWWELGEWLKTEQSLENVPEPWKEKVDLKESLSWNIENSFQQHKKNLSKISGTEERIALLREEIKAIENGERKVSEKKAPSLMHQSEAKGRTWDLGEHRLYMGKSGKDNLNLLRKAKPWYLWLHIRDYPGTHGIIERQRKQELSREILAQAAQHVIKQSLGESAKGNYSVVIAECRYVKPVKSAKSGQVTYSHEKVIHIKV